MSGKTIYDDILWSIPEQKTGTVQIIGGNSSNFASVIRIAEELNRLPLKNVRILLPDALRGKLPPLPDISFASSTTSGSFAKSPELATAMDDADLTFLLGDLSKNSATAIAITEALKSSTKPAVITRDAVDLITPEMPSIIEKPGLIFIASMAQLQKLLRAVYYPKMLLLSMPLIPTLEVLHKFTLSYPCTILTFLGGNIIVAKDGKTATLPIAETHYTPLSLWSGTLAGKVAALTAWNPSQPYEATLAALHYDTPRATS